jgi:hypothetical protein
LPFASFKLKVLALIELINVSLLLELVGYNSSSIETNGLLASVGVTVPTKSRPSIAKISTTISSLKGPSRKGVLKIGVISDNELTEGPFRLASLVGLGKFGVDNT